MNVALLGCGGHARACADVLQSAGIVVAGVITPHATEAEKQGWRWLGDDAWLNTAAARAYQYLIGVGQVHLSGKRRQLYESLKVAGLDLATVAAADAVVSSCAQMGEGSIVLHRAVINTAVRIGTNCIVNTGAIIEHDVVIADHCHISTGAIVNGGAQVASGTMIGSGAIVLQEVRICADAMIGAGAVVTHDVEEAGVWVGVPARRVS